MMRISDEVRDAIAGNRAVVALESTLIAHGLPHPTNLEVAREAEAAVRAQGAVPATIAILHGVPTVGLSAAELQMLATAPGVLKASRRDLGVAMATGATAATTVSGTLCLAKRVGIRVFATGGIGGAHRPPAHPWDISADIADIARSAMLTVCAGAKSLLDLPRTLELLEAAGVPVLGYRTNTFPEFYTRGGSLPVTARVETPLDAAKIATHQATFGTGTLLCLPLPEEQAIPSGQFRAALTIAEADAARDAIGGAQLTPYLLARLAVLTNGATLVANKLLILKNCALAAEVAAAIAARGE